MMCIQTGNPADAVIQIWNYKLIIAVGVNEILSFLSTFPFFIFIFFIFRKRVRPKSKPVTRVLFSSFSLKSFVSKQRMIPLN